MRGLTSLLFGCAMSLMLGAAAAADAAAAAGSDEEALGRLRTEIVQLVGQPTCSNLVHCRVLALGTRPCGGPAEYLAYSSITSNRELLEAKAYEYSFLEEEINTKRAAAGACEVLPQPRVVCIDRRCRLAPLGQ